MQSLSDLSSSGTVARARLEKATKSADKVQHGLVTLAAEKTVTCVREGAVRCTLGVMWLLVMKGMQHTDKLA